MKCDSIGLAKTEIHSLQHTLPVLNSLVAGTLQMSCEMNQVLLQVALRRRRLML